MMDRIELFVFGKKKRGGGGTEERDKCGSAISAGAVAEITVIPRRAEAADCHTETRNSLTAQSVTALSYCGILFCTIV